MTVNYGYVGDPLEATPTSSRCSMQRSQLLEISVKPALRPMIGMPEGAEIYRRVGGAVQEGN